ncbi:hypothetical protein MB02_01060 [Croceicoccus estronivorus]|nr:hypothetical protein MB02_01060 [Croceicoccus estronivorus]
MKMCTAKRIWQFPHPAAPATGGVLEQPYMPYIGGILQFFTLPFALHAPYLIAVAQPYIYEIKI